MIKNEIIIIEFTLLHFNLLEFHPSILDSIIQTRRYSEYFGKKPNKRKDQKTRIKYSKIQE